MNKSMKAESKNEDLRDLIYDIKSFIAIMDSDHHPRKSTNVINNFLTGNMDIFRCWKCDYPAKFIVKVLDGKTILYSCKDCMTQKQKQKAIRIKTIVECFNIETRVLFDKALEIYQHLREESSLPIVIKEYKFSKFAMLVSTLLSMVQKCIVACEENASVMIKMDKIFKVLEDKLMYFI
ncbi:unnamed protein product [Moneuplotes crassus]|uniref:Uncharacterized protein n=1 Tax=Euplotes crassus TaxID=5936 RepID=A0AAD1XF85_EUPCR|nr:unnamed protein product [Moneuplotes crassus]